MSTTLNALVAKIETAFTRRQMPSEDALVTGEDYECLAIRNALAGKDWKEVGADVWNANQQSLPLLTPEAFQYYFPSYMLAALRNDPSGMLSFLALEALRPLACDHELRTFWTNRIAGFTLDETRAIAQFIEFSKRELVSPDTWDAKDDSMLAYWTEASEL